MESLNLKAIIKIRDDILDIAENIKDNDTELYDKLKGISEEIDEINSDEDNYDWPMPITKFCNLFGLNRNTVHRHKARYLKRGRDFFTDRMGNTKATCFHKSGAIKILTKYKTDKAAKYLRKQGINIFLKEEHQYLDIIKYAVEGFDNPEKKFRIPTSNKNYEIDLYLKNTKLAIECDEHDHYVQEYLDELDKREQDIIHVLGCKFLRFNPHDFDFNIGKTLNAIFLHIFRKTIDGKDPMDEFMKQKRSTTRKRSKINYDDFE